jgi:hypothetical protein
MRVKLSEGGGRRHCSLDFPRSFAHLAGAARAEIAGAGAEVVAAFGLFAAASWWAVGAALSSSQMGSGRGRQQKSSAVHFFRDAGALETMRE